MTLRKFIRILTLIGAMLVLMMVGPTLVRTLCEVVPLPVHVGNFDPAATDRRWLALRGRVAAEVGFVAPADGATWLASLYLPIVPAGWKRGDPVRAFTVRGPYSPEEADKKVRDAGTWQQVFRQIGRPRVYDEAFETVTGTRVDVEAAAPFLRGRFNLAPGGAVLIQEGTRPSAAPGKLFIAVVCVLAVGYNAIRLSGDVPPRPEEMDEDEPPARPGRARA